MAVSTIYNAQDTTEEDSLVALATSSPVPAPRAARRCTRSRIWWSLTRRRIPTEQAALAASDSDSDDKINWKSKLAIEATECVFRGVHLSAPPFPFRQRWDANARHEIGERKNRGRKRKRREYEEYDDEEYDYFNNEDFQKMYDTIAATLATVAAAHTTAHPTKRRKKAMKKKKQGGAAGGDGAAAPAGSSV
ncbi:uncharacterized protein P174DRAFT_459437 [Aspergillus novofumigatus IBT 16806]|uniref:Uncharacterized protein n=1 Tax=Aspergillus novofumigatus (strain IBT 16806) TaxID=1392255 RepID=A0A2I1CE86_ASPN1|nr:uncharacterized protein P174DRAFT_459437 [Aspergillus novofumigatus IBT 16806]PKX95942.1 hypothetical protein P174DRAFT_459437 [Aspergillus novofumigatus IBT 16806]